MSAGSRGGVAVAGVVGLAGVGGLLEEVGV